MELQLGELLAIGGFAVTVIGLLIRGAVTVNSLKGEVKEIRDDLHDMNERLEKAETNRVLRSDEISTIKETLTEMNTTLKISLKQLFEQVVENKHKIEKNQQDMADLFKNYDLKKRNGGHPE